MGKRFRLTAPIAPEHSLQAQIAKLLAIEIAPAGRLSRRGVVWWSIDIADYGGDVPGTRVDRGIIAGVPDIFILWNGRAHHIELKTDVGILSPPQRSVCAGIILAGGQIAVARGADSVLAALDAWNIPRNNRTRIAA